MIKVTIYQSSEGEILGFAIQGHAGYAESGSDIVCAAVSVLAQNTVNSIEQFTQDGFSADVDEEEKEDCISRWSRDTPKNQNCFWIPLSSVYRG